MNISSVNLNKIAFQKELRAKCNVLKNGEKMPCKIYELDSYNPDDLDYFVSLKETKDWRENSFFQDIESDLIVGTLSRFYVMEDEKGCCLGACEVGENYDEKSDELIFLEVSKTKSHQNKTSETKYIGETLIRYLVGLAKKDKKKEFTIIDPTPYALPFYLKQGFRERYFDENLSIKSSEFDKIIEKNATHVGKMEYIG